MSHLHIRNDGDGDDFNAWGRPLLEKNWWEKPRWSQYEQFTLEGDNSIIKTDRHGLSHMIRKGLFQKEDFDWMEYVLENDDLWNADIRTEEKALEHYRDYGVNEERSSVDRQFYQVDLNVYKYHGLFNQIYCLINAIIIGHYTRRDIQVAHFYPDYNLADTIPLQQIIDTEELNMILMTLGLTTRVVVEGAISKQHDSQYKNWVITGTPVEIFKKLRGERRHALYLGNVFFFMIQRSAEPKIQRLFERILNRIPWSQEVYSTVSSLKKHLNLTQYSSIHLRMEDDIILSGGEYDVERMREKYEEKIGHLSENIFVATGLLKSRNREDDFLKKLMERYPEMRTSTGWRDKISTQLPSGREIDGLIDYLICRGSDSCVGYRSSTMSEALSLSDIPFTDCSPHTGDVYDVICSHLLCERMISSAEKLRAHAPSYIVLRVKRRIYIQGHCASSAENPSRIFFRCNGDFVGAVEEPLDTTTPFRLDPGIHILTTEAESNHWAHSVWLFKTIPEDFDWREYLLK